MWRLGEESCKAILCSTILRLTSRSQFKGLAKIPGLIETTETTGDDGNDYSLGPSFPLLFVSQDRKYHDNFLSILVQHAVEKHVSCSRDPRIRVNIPKFLSIQYTTFHVTFFELMKKSPNNSSSSWKTGSLYGDGEEATKGKCIRESACTVSYGTLRMTCALTDDSITDTYHHGRYGSILDVLVHEAGDLSTIYPIRNF